MNEQTLDIEAVLAEHEWLQYIEYGPCSCGDVSAFTAATHRAHVAQALAPVLAAAVREARAAELREAADRMPAYHDGEQPEWAITAACRWLRDRADRIDVDAPEGGACDHDWEVEYLPDPHSGGGVVRSGDLRCPRCFATKEDR